MPAQNWKQIGEREYTRLAARYPTGTVRDILRAVKGSLIRDSLDTEALAEALALLGELKKEFASGPALMILRAADQSAAQAERAYRAKHSTPRREGANAQGGK